MSTPTTPANVMDALRHLCVLTGADRTARTVTIKLPDWVTLDGLEIGQSVVVMAQCYPVASQPIPCGSYWCIRPGKPPDVCLIRQVQDEPPSGEPLPCVAIRFLESGAEFYFDRWRHIHGQGARFVPVLPPSTPNATGSATTGGQP